MNKRRRFKAKRRRQLKRRPASFIIGHLTVDELAPFTETDMEYLEARLNAQLGPSRTVTISGHWIGASE